MKNKFLILAIILITIGAIIGGVFGRLPAKSSANTGLSEEGITDDYSEAIELIDQKYVEKIEREKVLDSSIQGMLWTLDPHSSFFTRDEFRKLYEEQQSQFYGIGVSILRHRDGVYVQSVIPNTPADKEGIRFGDRFFEVEGKDATDWSGAEVSKNVRGERGTKVNVKVKRAGQEEPLEFTITRGGVPLPSIRNYFMLKDNVGYVGLSGGFQETTAEELDQAIADLKKQGMEKLLLDLRGNPGGLLPQAVEVTSRFVPEGQTVVSVKGRIKDTQFRELRSVGGTLNDFPLVVMINGGSASASEIVAGAIQDYGRGLVVGSESFGKGLVQKIYPLPYGTGLTLTTARYYTPYGRSLQRDYSSGSIYDYYTHANDFEEGVDVESAEEKPKPKGEAVKTAGGRVFYGGRGIEPDLKAPNLAYTPLRARINEAAFFYVRELVAGEIKGFESYRTEKQNYALTIGANDIQIGDGLFNSFISYTVSDKKNGLSGGNIKSQEKYAKARLRELIATAKYSGEAGQQVFLENDPQVLKAIDALPEAKKLIDTILAKK
jgi:carboxyl-terminal processing protease